MHKFQYRLFGLLTLTTICCLVFAAIAFQQFQARNVERYVLELQSKGTKIQLLNDNEVYIAGKSHPSEIIRVDLSLSNPKYSQLEKIHWVESLRSLNLTDTKADDKILNSLQDLTNLETVVVFNSKISQSAIDAFSKRRPDVLILNTENTIDGLRAIIK
jgi:hypothetical protein